MGRAFLKARGNYEGFGVVAMNISLAKKVLESLAGQGVQDILLCAGARNSPLVVLLDKAQGFRVWNFFEERSAGFFALGRAQRDHRPVAIITTSGTAVAELLPAAIEATYTQTPLIFVSADRPQSYRGTGAPQSIEQVGLFGHYVEACHDIVDHQAFLDFSQWSQRAPVHINVCFDEPLIDEPIPELRFSNLHRPPGLGSLLAPESEGPRLLAPLVIVGPLSVEQADRVAPLLAKLGAPIYAESLSNLRGHPAIQSLLVQSGEKLVRDLFKKGWAQSVLRIGGVPTLRFWRDLEEEFQKTPVLSISDARFSGLSRPVNHLIGLENLELIAASWSEEDLQKVTSLDAEKKRQLSQLLQAYPRSEVSLLARLSQKMQSKFTYIGNSLPIREWDLVSSYAERSERMAGNRGANGIDGQVSSFLGGIQAQGQNWAFIGDLTALYDLSSLWVTPQLEAADLRLVVINNGGGLIFKNLFGQEIFLNRHQIQFSHWAHMWNWSHQTWTEIPEDMTLPSKVVIELSPDPEQSEVFWREYRAL
jgi:2-succinyl-5-enolpyruvyl-6-hydroxy-3-cyclohexene-1-carboxylate synthase